MRHNVCPSFNAVYFVLISNYSIISVLSLDLAYYSIACLFIIIHQNIRESMCIGSVFFYLSNLRHRIQSKIGHNVLVNFQHHTMTLRNHSMLIVEIDEDILDQFDFLLKGESRPIRFDLQRKNQRVKQNYTTNVIYLGH